MQRADKKQFFESHWLISNIKEEYFKDWHEGQWQNEPDFLDFMYKGYNCLSHRNIETGTWEAYIYLDKDSKYNKEAERNKLKISRPLIFELGYADDDSSADFNTISWSYNDPLLDVYPVVTTIKKAVHAVVKRNKVKKVLEKISSEISTDGNIKINMLTDTTKQTYKNVAFIVKELKALVDQLV